MITLSPVGTWKICNLRVVLLTLTCSQILSYKNRDAYPNEDRRIQGEDDAESWTAVKGHHNQPIAILCMVRIIKDMIYSSANQAINWKEAIKRLHK